MTRARLWICILCVGVVAFGVWAIMARLERERNHADDRDLVPSPSTTKKLNEPLGSRGDSSRHARATEQSHDEHQHVSQEHETRGLAAPGERKQAQSRLAPAVSVEGLASQERAIIEKLRSGTQSDRLTAAEDVVRSPTPATVKALIEEAGACSDLAMRQHLLNAVRRLDGSRYAGDLSAVLGDTGNGDLRAASLDALVSSGSPEAVMALRTLAEANATSERVVRYIGRGLTRFTGYAAVPELLRSLDSDLPAVQAGSISALAAIGTPDAVLGLYARFDGSKPALQEMIIEGFRRVQSPESLPALRRIANDTRNGDLKAVIEKSVSEITAALTSGVTE